MTELLRIAIQTWCDEVREHDNWTWGNTCARLIEDVNYSATSEITRERIRCTLNDGRPVELLRLEHGWGVRWGKDAVVPPVANNAATESGLYNCECCGEEKCSLPGICDDCLAPPTDFKKEYHASYD